MSSVWKIKLVKESTPPSCPNIKVCRAPSTAGGIGGSEQFREYLLKKVDATAIRRNRNYQSAQMGLDHGQAEAEKIVQQGLERYALSENDLESLPGNDPRKVSIAGFIHQSTTTPQGWTAQRLQMKRAVNVSQLLSRAKKAGKPKIKPAKPAT
jgi:hypothetical protein